MEYMNLKVGFKDFLTKFFIGNHVFVYQRQIIDHYNLGEYWIRAQLEEVASFDEFLANEIKKRPGPTVKIFEDAITETCDKLTQPRAEGKNVPQFQVILASISTPLLIRELNSELISTLVTVSGIVVGASFIRPRITKLATKCIGCKTVYPQIPLKRGLDGYQLSRVCKVHAAVSERCPTDPFRVIFDECETVDSQILKAQEAPEQTLSQHMPRSLKIYSDGFLCNKLRPGDRVVLHGVYSTTTSCAMTHSKKHSIGAKSAYLHLLGYEVKEGGFVSRVEYTEEEEEDFKCLASSKNCYEKICSSIAPSIYGLYDIKKAIACMLFAGTDKLVADGTRRRGDIHVLLLGDPGTAKSQLLKFVSIAAPVAIYTSGKGSSAAGLTASVIKNNRTRQFFIEAGALILADRGAICIDEFDKMREDDRVAMHEAMEQQTISIAKAGITITLNSRCSILAAANPAFGRWNDSLSDNDNIDFMPTILSRFDLVFVIKDKSNRVNDIRLSRHVSRLHTAVHAASKEVSTEDLSLNFMRKFISYCRSKCSPRLSQAAAELLRSHFVQTRQERSRTRCTVRRLEAIVRVSEAIAKMHLDSTVSVTHAQEAIRLLSSSENI